MTRDNFAISKFRPPFQNCEIAKNGLSPDGQFAFVIIHPIRGGESMTQEVPGLFDCLMCRSFPGKYMALPTQIQSSNEKRKPWDGTVRWAKDSSAVLAFNNSKHGAYDIYVVPIIDKQAGKIANLGAEICEIPREDFLKAHAKPINEALHVDYFIIDEGMDDNLTFNDANQIVINCLCDNLEGYAVQVRALWDPVRGKFTKQSYERVPSFN